jgi:GNAT superfamily N-acetyltransferase
MTGHRILAGANSKLRVTPWRGDGTTAYLTPTRGRPSLAIIEQCLSELPSAGYDSAITAALPGVEQIPFLQAGFTVLERLHLLKRTLHDIPRPSGSSVDLRRTRPPERPAILAIDAASFPPFWRLDNDGLTDAVAATPSARLSVAVTRGDGTPIVGYAITGRAGSRGYLQRLAVDPAAHRQGIGSALVIDGLRWLRRWGAREILVNTQEGNGSAVALYEHLGFRLQPDGLAVLQRSLAGPA